MSLDLTLLQILKHREKYNKLFKAIPLEAVDVKTKTLLIDFGKYFEEFPDTNLIEYDNFISWFPLVHPNLNAESRAFYSTILQRIDYEVDTGIEQGIMMRLVASAAAVQLATLLESWNDGDDVDLYESMLAVIDDFEKQTDRQNKSAEVIVDIDDLLLDDINDVGFHWRQQCLNESMRPAREGDFIILAARPDKGKTTFLTDNLTYMAAQIDLIYPEQERCIVWFNNEGPGKRIIGRLHQSALNANIPDLVAKSQAGTLKQDYANALGGRGNIIKVYDVHDFYNYEIEDIIKKENPALIVFDMIDNIKFGGNISNGGSRTDQFLEAQYQWARVIGVKYNAVVIVTSQISGDGDGLIYPLLHMLKDSKTGKQGAADVIITLGASNDLHLAGSRFIGCTKNKSRRSGFPQDPRCEVRFDVDRGRFVQDF